jgi:hypothetical protein
MARGVKIDINHGTIQSYLDGGHGVSGLLHSKAAAVLSAAQSSAPVASGEYRDGLHIEEAHTDRLVVRVSGSTDHDWIVEAKTGNLARALDSA